MIMDAVSEYLELFNDSKNAEKLTRIFWSISDFPADFLFEKLQECSEADFDDDYSEFLKENNLLKAGLAVLGINSPGTVEKIIRENPRAQDRLAKVSELFPLSAKGYLAGIRSRFEEDYPGELFPCMLSTVAILLVRSKKYLTAWSRNFSRIFEKHPTPGQSIRNVLSLVFRGEALVVDNYSTTHRSFNNCSKLFIELVNDEDKKARDLIWMKKHTRILDALGGK